MRTEAVTYNKQCYFKLSSGSFDPQSSLLSVLQSQTCTHKARDFATYIMYVTFDPGTLHSSSLSCSSVACNKGDYSQFLQSEERMSIWHEVRLLCVYNDTALTTVSLSLEH